ncbi:MAG: ATP-binding protein [Saprospiraceae bacterium]|nr:ATP-binding protein [Saprospiraceae bacterium]MBP9209070.1 ATP-binding protein [Saprospiraceae bacterium]
MITRIAGQKLLDLASKFKAVAVTGARQTGKTTLIQRLFKDKPYVSLENPDDREFALKDPRAFLGLYRKGAVLDEVQRTPELFSYLQEILDKSQEKGLFILSGSNNFLMQQSISQSLAGRIAYLNLLPFSLNELDSKALLPKSDDELMLQGFYPPIYDQHIPAADWCPYYIKTYIERDVRLIKNINDLLVFERFVKLLAGRVGQELNFSALALETGIDVKTVQSWVGILESSFIIYLLKPHYKNFRKTIVKRSKIYFYDTAIVCYLLRIHDAAYLNIHAARGAIFENMVVTELVKNFANAGLPVDLYFWRDKTGHEIDIIIEQNNNILPIEIKSGKTIGAEYFKNLIFYKKISASREGIVLYSGDSIQKRTNGISVYPWRIFCSQITFKDDRILTVTSE